MPILPAVPPHSEVVLSAYYKDAKGKLRHLAATMAIDPEGVTEEDAQRLRSEAYKHLRPQSMMISVVAEQKNFIEPVLVLIKGGKV